MPGSVEPVVGPHPPRARLRRSISRAIGYLLLRKTGDCEWLHRAKASTTRLRLMRKAAGLETCGTLIGTKKQENSARRTAPPTLCGSPGACTSPGRTTTRSVSIRIPEIRLGDFI